MSWIYCLEKVELQVEFLKNLEDGTRLVPDVEKLESVDQFKKILSLSDCPFKVLFASIISIQHGRSSAFNVFVCIFWNQLVNLYANLG